MQTANDVWDWAAKFSEETHRRARSIELLTEIVYVGMQCGDCGKWMKSRECPRERNVAGQSHGPSYKAPKCGQFVEAPSATARRERLLAERAALATGTP